MPDEIIIREARPDDSIAAITKLLHAAYAPLAARGFRYTATYQDDEVTRRRLERGRPWVAERNGEIVATITLYDSPSPTSNCRWYLEAGVWTIGQFAVRPDIQRQGLGSRLMGMIEEQARAGKARELALDTAEGALDLIRWYGQHGFRFIEYADWSSTNYRSVILSKSLLASRP